MRNDDAIDQHDGDSRTVEHLAADWLARRDGSTWDRHDAEALDAWLSADTAHRVAFLRLEAAWAESERLKALGAGLRGTGTPPDRGHWSALHADVPIAPPDLREMTFAARSSTASRRGGRRLATAAAAVACALGLGLGLRTFEPPDISHHATAIGRVDAVALADGSVSTLASDSRIEVRLSRRERRIVLQQGEAFFEAAKDASRPFVVEAGDRRVVAVGTRFAVRRDGPDLRVVVTEGTVRLETGTGADDRPSALLPAGSLAIARRDGVLVRTVPLADAERLVDWRSGLLVFRDALLSEAAAEFNRYNTRKIVIADAGVADLRIGGSFRWENAEAFVRLLEQGFPVRAEYGHDRIVLHAP